MKHLNLLMQQIKVFFRTLLWNKSRVRSKFKGSCLKQEDTTSFTPNNVVNLFMVYELYRWSGHLNSGFTLKDCFFGAVMLTKNADPDIYVYTGYGIGFNSCSEFSKLKMSLFFELT